ncbi:hypothetical protein ACB098_11G091200 [Castanea mollissima]
MFPYNIASLILEILCLKYVLNDSLRHRNPRDALESGKPCLKQGRMSFCKALCVREDGPTYEALTSLTQG